MRFIGLCFCFLEKQCCGEDETDECVSCGKCAASCPLNNIKLVEGRPVWGDDCTHCMAFINLCPKQAIEYGEKTVGKFRHKCPRYKAGT